MKFITLFLTAVLSCCGNTKEAANYQDQATLKSMETLSGTYKIAFITNNTENPEELSITFDDTTNKVSGFSGCNNFFADYTVEGSSINFGIFGMTQAICKRFMDVEENMMNTLAEANSFTIENGALKLYNAKTESFIKAIKKNEARIAQDDGYILEYTAQTRGSYKMVSIQNNMVSYSMQRGADPLSRACSEVEINSIVEKLDAIELEELSKLEAPSEDRHTDRVAIGRFKIIHKGVTYETPQFDDGNPNEYIADLVKTMTSMIEKQ